MRVPLAKYAYLGTYLGAPNMVKWGVPEEILQKVVQTRCSIKFLPISPLKLQCKLHLRGNETFMGL